MDDQNYSQVRWRGEQDDSAVDDLKTLFDCGVDFMDHGQAGDATGSLEEYVDGMYNLVQPPLETLVRAEDKLRTCYNNMGTVIFQVVIPVNQYFLFLPSKLLVVSPVLEIVHITYF